MYPQLHDRDWLEREYLANGRSTPEIAKEIGCSPATVQWNLKKLGIKARGRHYGRWNPKVCERCGVEYTPSGPAQQYCSEKCQAGTGICEQCGVEFVMSAQRGPNGTIYKRRFCSTSCKGTWQKENGHTRKGQLVPVGTKRITEDLYVLIRVPVDTPGIRRDRPWMLEHRYVMQLKLGRVLDDAETVHHKNGNRGDNVETNLELRDGRHGKGAKFMCADCGSHNIVPVTLTLS